MSVLNRLQLGAEYPDSRLAWWRKVFTASPDVKLDFHYSELRAGLPPAMLFACTWHSRLDIVRGTCIACSCVLRSTRVYKLSTQPVRAPAVAQRDRHPVAGEAARCFFTTAPKFAAACGINASCCP